MNLKQEIKHVLRSNNHRRVNGDKASDLTQEKREAVVFHAFDLLHEMGYRFEHVKSFKERHMQALVDYWIENGASASTIQNNTSVLRTFSSWIGKAGMIRPTEYYVRDRARVRRSSIATTDRSLSAQDVDFPALLEQAWSIEPYVGMTLEIMAAFGLRPQEALMLRPHLAVCGKGQLLDVERGPKGNRERFLDISTPYQEATLEKAKAFVGAWDESIAGPVTQRSKKRARMRFYTVTGKIGMTRENGLMPYCLRHEAVNKLFAEKAGYLSPVQGGPVPDDPHRDNYARLACAKFLGHSRPRIATTYIGRAMKGVEKKSE